MASNDSQQQVANEKRAYRENEMEHFATISKSIGNIVANSTNDQFKLDICNVLNAKMGCRKRTIQAKAIKLMKENYSQSGQSMRDKNTAKNQTNDNEQH